MDSLIGKMKYINKYYFTFASLAVLFTIYLFVRLRGHDVRDTQDHAEAIEKLRYIGMCVDGYVENHETLPKSLYEAVFEWGVGVPAIWKQKGDAIDPWGRAYKFKYMNRQMRIWSCGKNLLDEDGLGDDIKHDVNTISF